MLAFFAALVPVLASLYVAGGTMRDHFSQAHIARSSARIWERYEAEVAAVEDGDPNAAAKFEAATARRMMLLESNGVDPWVGTARALNASVMPSMPSTIELRRQWVLLASAVVGVVLLAIEMLTS